jgi:hypothetical protein
MTDTTQEQATLGDFAGSDDADTAATADEETLAAMADLLQQQADILERVVDEVDTSPPAPPQDPGADHDISDHISRGFW